jgi:hypothetical protein
VSAISGKDFALMKVSCDIEHTTGQLPLGGFFIPVTARLINLPPNQFEPNLQSSKPANLIG